MTTFNLLEVGRPLNKPRGGRRKDGKLSQTKDAIRLRAKRAAQRAQRGR